MKSGDMKVRNKLKEVRDQLAGARSERTRLKKDRDDARDAFGEADFSEASDITQCNEFLEAERTVAALGSCEDNIASLENAEAAILKMIGSDEMVPSGNGNGPGGGQVPISYGWNGHALLRESETYTEAVQSNIFHSDAHFGTLPLGKVCSREEFVQFVSSRWAAALPTAPGAPIGTDQGAVRPDVRGIYPAALKPLTLLDIIPTGTTDSNIVQYVQVTGIPGYAAETAEMALKPQEGISFNDATAPVRTIAGWIKMARQAMDDMAGLATLVNTLLPYDVRRRLENQILQGDGTGQNLLGIMNTTGIGAPASVTGDNILDGILRAITAVVLSDGDPSWVAMNPLSWQSMAIMKSSGSGEYMLEEPGGIEAWAGNVGLARAARTDTLWGLTVTKNRLIPQASPLVGDPMGATVLVREGVNVKTSDADQDDFVRNRVTVLAETRVAFPVWRPSAFAKAPLG
jgi:hypothetical protein